MAAQEGIQASRRNRKPPEHMRKAAERRARRPTRSPSRAAEARCAGGAGAAAIWTSGARALACGRRRAGAAPPARPSRPTVIRAAASARPLVSASLLRCGSAIRAGRSSSDDRGAGPRPRVGPVAGRASARWLATAVTPVRTRGGRRARPPRSRSPSRSSSTTAASPSAPPQYGGERRGGGAAAPDRPRDGGLGPPLSRWCRWRRVALVLIVAHGPRPLAARPRGRAGRPRRASRSACSSTCRRASTQGRDRDLLPRHRAAADRGLLGPARRLGRAGASAGLLLGLYAKPGGAARAAIAGAGGGARGAPPLGRRGQRGTARTRRQA